MRSFNVVHGIYRRFSMCPVGKVIVSKVTLKTLILQGYSVAVVDFKKVFVQRI